MKRSFMTFKSVKTAALSILLLGGVHPAYAVADFDPRPPVDPEYHYYYPVTVSVYPEGAGWASGGGKFEAGTSVWLSTSANSGYVFSHWEKDGVECSNKSSFSYTLGDERPHFVAVYEYKPAAPGDPQNNYEPKKRLYLTCNQEGCSFNMTSGDKRVIGKTLNIQAYLSSGYTIIGWYEGDSLIATSSGFNYVMPDYDVTLRVEIEYNPMIPGDPASVGGDIALEADNLDDIDPHVPNSLFYFEKTSFTYTGKPLALGYYSRLNPTVESLDELGTEVGTYSARIDVTIKNDTIDTHRVFNFEYSITQAELTASAGVYTKTYGDENPEFTVQYKGFVNGETVSALTTVPKISTAAQKGSGVGEYLLELSDGTAKNYLVKTNNGKLTIQKAPIVIVPNDIEITYGETVSASQLDYTVKGFVNGDTISCFTTEPVVKIDGEGINAGTYGIVASGASADNYEISYVDGTLTVNKAPMTLTVKNVSKLYGAANPAFSYSALDKNGNDVDTALSVKPELNTVATVLSGVGEYEIKATGAESKNYSITVVDGVLTINRAPLTITPKDVMVSYGTDMTDYEYDFRYDGFVNGDYSTSLTQLPVVTIENYDTDVGTYNLVASGAQADNYEISYNMGTLTIAQAVLTLKISDTVKVYGEENPEFMYVVTDANGNDCLSELTVLPTFVTPAGKSSNVGVYDVTATGAESKNYSVSVVDGHLTIMKAPLIITPKDIVIDFGTDLKTLRPEFVYEGFVNGDAESSLAAKPMIVIVDNITTVGVYDITAAGAQTVNYEISYGVGKLTVEKLILTFAVKDATREYGEANPQFEYEIKDSVGNVLNVTVPVNITLESEAGATAGVGEYDIVAKVVFDSLNYSITAVNGKLTVTPATLTVTAVDVICQEGTSVFDLSYRIEGFKNGEDESVLTKKPVVSCEANGNSPAGDYTITASGAEADNYVFVYVDGNMNLYKTGVIGIESDEVYPVYDLTGRKVGTSADDLKPGIYIINGRKVMVR